jgi:hypothetical protein
MKQPEQIVPEETYEHYVKTYGAVEQTEDAVSQHVTYVVLSYGKYCGATRVSLYHKDDHV